MRNIDKYEKEIKEIIEKKETAIAIDKNLNKLKCCSTIACSDCLFNTNGTMKCAYNAIKWLMKEYKEPILDEVEKKYLEDVIKPFKDRVTEICKWCIDKGSKEEFIRIEVKDHKSEYYSNTIDLPWFEINTMYKGMKRKKRYTLKELGLFEGKK